MRQSLLLLSFVLLAACQDTTVQNNNRSPEISIISPLDGSVLEGGVAVSFSATVQDSEDQPEALAVTATSSLDQLLAQGIPDASHTFAFTATLSEGEHAIEFQVMDSEGSIGRDSIAITVGSINDPPLATITAPATGTRVNIGEQVTFEGTASDAEDAAQTLNLSWTSTIDQTLWAGNPNALGQSSFATSNLSVGIHVITLAASDSGNKEGSDTISIEVVDPELLDSDGDGFTPADGDCDDTDPNVHPGATEICNGVDDNCDGQIDEGFNTDGDGYTSCGGDCDDTDATVHPGATEVCNSIDDNCDGAIDEGLSTDADGDTHYALGSCATPADDCDDIDAQVHPGATEVCNSIDDNCNGLIDEGLSTDGDGDGHYAPGSCGGPADDCDDSNANLYPGAPEICNGLDDDCDTVIPIDERDIDGDQLRACEGDCDDFNPAVFPGHPELCNSIDDDCDTLIDEGLSVDLDGDGHFDLSSCLLPADDCDDGDAAIYPGAPELCDGLDTNCDGGIPATENDSDFDTWRVCDGDCDDGDSSIYPGAPEICDGIDQDCDGVVDNGFDLDADGVTTCAGDCDDTNATVFPGAPELCDGLDTDCTGGPGVDEVDADGDGWMICEGDCDDAEPLAFPGNPELCDTIDNDCNGLVDDNCALCGDGVVQLAEECDDGALNSDTLGDACRTNCLLPTCGDAVVDTGEECDDGNTLANDGCDPTCLREACILQGDQTGVITEAMSPCLVVADVTVPANQTLTLEAGVVLKFEVGRAWNVDDRDLTVSGTLNVQGTPLKPVTFTSYYDDTVAGDMNNDGATTLPLRGDWGRLRFLGAGGGLINDLVLRYGGGGNNGNTWGNENPASDATVSADQSVLPTFTGLNVQLSQSAGARLRNNGGFPAVLTDCVFSNNNGVGLDFGGGNAVTTLLRTITENNGGTGLSASTSGALTLADPISSSNGGAGIYVSTSNRLEIANATVQGNTNTYGLDIGAARDDSIITGCTVSGNLIQVRTPPSLVEGVVINNTLLDMQRGLAVRGGTITIPSTWPEPGFVYVFQADVTVGGGTSLTLDPGVVIKMPPGRAWNVDDVDFILTGDLIANGTALLPIVFTSLYDDGFGGDTNVDGVATTPLRGDWGHLRVASGPGSSLQNVIVRYAGGGNNGNTWGNENPAGDAGISVQVFQAPTLVDLLVEESQTRGMLLNTTGGFATSLSTSTFQNNSSVGLEVNQGNGPLTVNLVDATGSGGNGFTVNAGGAASLTQCSAVGSGGNGLQFNVGGALALDGITSDGNASFGVNITAASASSSITNTTVQNNGRLARVVPDLVQALLDPTNILLNTARGLDVTGGSITAASLWGDPGFEFVLLSSLTVQAGASLDLDPGVVIKMPPGRSWNAADVSINVSGTLNMNGVLGSPVVLSSYYDDTAGSDTNGDGVMTLALPGDWASVTFNGGSSGTLSFVEMRYGGGGNNGNTWGNENPVGVASFRAGSTMTLTDSSIKQSQSSGASITGGLGTITNSAFDTNTLWGLTFANTITCANWIQSGNTYLNNGSGGLNCP